jgi:hypothetical protein
MDVVAILDASRRAFSMIEPRFCTQKRSCSIEGTRRPVHSAERGEPPHGMTAHAAIRPRYGVVPLCVPHALRHPHGVMFLRYCLQCLAYSV